MVTIIKTPRGKWATGFLVLFMAGTLLASCSNSGYVSTIPSNCIALMSADMTNADGIDGQHILKKALGIDDAAHCGINFQNRLYAYETADGNIGFCASVDDADKLDALLQPLSGKNGNGTMKKRNGMRFILLKNWLVGYTEQALHMVGPITAEKRSETEQFLSRVLQQDEDRSIVATSMFARLDSMQAPMCLIAQAQALPEKLVAPFTLGAPKDADASQIMIAARMYFQKGMLHIEGSTFSENNRISHGIQQSLSIFRPITGSLVKTFDTTCQAGLFMNVSGTAFLPVLQQNRSIQGVLAGINTAIDMNKILQSIDGDFILTYTSDTQCPVMLTAKLGNDTWLSDIAYWKQSCPAGTALTDQGVNLYCYSGQGSRFFFGVSPDRHFISGPTLSQCRNSLQPSLHPLPANVASTVTGSKIAMLLNIGAMTKADPSGIAEMLTTALKGTRYIVYTLH